MSVQTTHRGTDPPHSHSGWQGAPQGWYRRPPREGYSPLARKQQNIVNLGERPARRYRRRRERGCRPHALEQRLEVRPAGSVQTTPGGGDTAPTRASSDEISTRMSVPRVGTNDHRGRGCRPHALARLQVLN